MATTGQSDEVDDERSAWPREVRVARGARGAKGARDGNARMALIRIGKGLTRLRPKAGNHHFE